MLSMFNMVRNENMKIYRRISTIIMIGILVLIVLAAALIIKFVEKDSKGDWRANLTKQNQNYQTTLMQPGVPKASKDSLTSLLKINEYRLAHNIPPESDKSLWGFTNGAKGVISIIALFVIILGSSSTANEFSSGTIKLLLIRPVKRWKILLSKYISTLMAALLMLIILFVTSILLGGILFGFKGISQPYLAYSNGVVRETNYVLQIFFEYGLKCVDLIMMVTLAFMISVVFRNNALAIGIGVFLLLSGSMIVALFSQYDWVKYILFANTDLNQYFDGTPLVKSMTLGFSLAVITIYFAVFNIISWTTFIKRDVAA